MVKQGGTSSGSRVLRGIAFLLMITGAAGFVVSVLFFPEQVLYLFASTLVTFIGLGLVIVGRKRQRAAASGDALSDTAPTAVTRGKPEAPEAPEVPVVIENPVAREEPAVVDPSPAAEQPQAAGDHEAEGLGVVEPVVVQESPAAETPAPEAEEAARAYWQPVEIHEPGSLVGAVNRAFARRGDQVVIETSRDERHILRVASKEGREYTVLVMEDRETVDAADVRALTALVANNGSQGGVLITLGPITDRARAIAASRAIRLLHPEQLGEL